MMLISIAVWNAIIKASLIWVLTAIIPNLPFLWIGFPEAELTRLDERLR